MNSSLGGGLTHTQPFGDLPYRYGFVCVLENIVNDFNRFPQSRRISVHRSGVKRFEQFMHVVIVLQFRDESSVRASFSFVKVYLLLGGINE